MKLDDGHQYQQARIPRWVLCTLIVLAVLICFGNTVRGEFTLWDDVFNIAHNDALNPPTVSKVMQYWRAPAYALYVPVTYSTWGILAAMAYLPTPDEFGTHLNPLVFHAANVICHAIASIVAFLLIEQLIHRRGAACIGALVFALHPVQVESVAWAAGLKDVLAGMFALIALLQYVRAVDPQNPYSTSERRARYAGATVALVLAMLSKPSAMVTPAIALVIDLTLMRRPIRKSLLALAPWFALAITCAIIAKLAQPAPDVPRAPLWARPFIAGDALAFYLHKILLPVRFGIDYGRRPDDIMHRPWFYIAWIIPASLFLWLWLHRRERPQLWTGALVFLVAISPVLGFATFLFQYYSTTADHYLYIPMVGIGIIAASIVARASRQARAIAIASIAVALLGVQSILQTRVWMNDQTLFTHAIEVNPSTFVARNNLGAYYRFRGEHDLALQLFHEAVELRPDVWQGQDNLGSTLIDIGDVEGGIAHIRQSIRLIDGLSRQAQAGLLRDRKRLEAMTNRPIPASAPATSRP